MRRFNFNRKILLYQLFLLKNGIDRNFFHQHHLLYNQFVQQILIHLPPKNFKMINRFSFYARNITIKLKDTVKKYKKKFSKSEYSFYVKQSIDTFDVHPFMCPYCKIMMDIQESYVSADWYGRTIHKIYF